MKRTRTNAVSFGWAAACAVALLGLTACSQEEASAQKSKPLTAEEQIKQIESNPHMPQKDKDAAEARLRAQSQSTDTIQKAVNK